MCDFFLEIVWNLRNNYYFYISNNNNDNQNTNPMTTQVTFSSEFERRDNLINNADFRAMCAKYAQSVGLTPKEWNENKVSIFMTIANEVCALENTK